MSVIETVDKVVELINSGKLEMYGCAVKKVTDGGKKIIVGHLEARKALETPIIGAVSSPAGSLSKLAKQTTAAQKVSSLSAVSSNMLGGLTSLGWANLAVSGINLGITAVGMYVISKKINTLSTEVHQMNGKIDTILQEMQQVKLLVSSLNENEVRKLYFETDRQMRHMKDLINELNSGQYSDAIRRETKKQLIDVSAFLDDLINRFNDTTCNIALSLDTIMSLFYTFMSLMKTYISVHSVYTS